MWCESPESLLVSRLDWCDSGEWGCLLQTWLVMKVIIVKEVMTCDFLPLVMFCCYAQELWFLPDVFLQIIQKYLWSVPDQAGLIFFNMFLTVHWQTLTYFDIFWQIFASSPIDNFDNFRKFDNTGETVKDLRHWLQFLSIENLN